MSQLEIKTRASGSEGGHWYNAEGLVEAVPSADGKRMVAPTLRHAKKFGLVPSVTTILSVAAKPGLDLWKKREFVKSAFHVWKARGMPPLEDGIDFSEITERDRLRNDHAQIGTDIHAEIARAWEAKGRFETPSPAPAARKAWDWLMLQRQRLLDSSDVAHPEDLEVESEKPFANFGLGFGGTVDWKFITPGEVWFVDFKTCDDDKVETGAKLAFRDSHLAQLVAYDMGANINAIEAERRYFNVFIGRFYGEIYVHEWTDEGDISWARDYFKACLRLFNVMKGIN